MKFLGHKFLIIVASIPCLIFGLLFFSQPANAAVAVTEATIGDNSDGGYINGNREINATITIPPHTADAILMCIVDNTDGWGPYNGLFAISGGGFTATTSTMIQGGYDSISYMVSPDAGSYNAKFYGTYFNGMYTELTRQKCWVLDNINTTTPVATSTQMISNQWGGGYDLSYAPTLVGNFILTRQTRGDKKSVDYSGATSTNQTIAYIKSGGGYNDAVVLGYVTSAAAAQSLTLTGVQDSWRSVQVFEFNAKADTGGGGGNNLEIIDAQTVEGLYFRFDNILNTCRVNMSCKIGFNFDTNIFDKDATGKVYYYATSTSTPTDLGQINLNTQGRIGIYGTGNIIATSSTPSTAYSYYQIVPHSDVWGKDYATTTAAVWFLSESDFTAQYDDVWNASNAIMTELGIDTYKLACTDEQWTATSSIPFLGVNVERMMCNTKKWVLDVGIKPMEALIGQVNKLKSRLLGIFPFNLIYKIQNGYQEATKSILGLIATPVYAGEISTTTGVYSGDFAFEVSDLFGDGKGTTKIILLSKENMENLIGVDGFNVFNIVCRLLVWTAFLAYCWWIATVRLHNVMGGNEQE